MKKNLGAWQPTGVPYLPISAHLVALDFMASVGTEIDPQGFQQSRLVANHPAFTLGPLPPNAPSLGQPHQHHNAKPQLFLLPCRLCCALHAALLPPSHCWWSGPGMGLGKEAANHARLSSWGNLCHPLNTAHCSHNASEGFWGLKSCKKAAPPFSKSHTSFWWYFFEIIFKRFLAPTTCFTVAISWFKPLNSHPVGCFNCHFQTDCYPPDWMKKSNSFLKCHPWTGHFKLLSSSL